MGSTLARRALGRKLHVLRKRADVSQARAAAVLGISSQTMGRLEEGLSARSASDLYMNTLCDLYRASDNERRLVLALAYETRLNAKYGGGWWRAQLDRTIADFDPYAALEDAAVRLTAWGVIVLPAIVRTPDYCRAVAWTRSPNAPTEEIEEWIQRETKRQRRLEDSTFDIEIFVSEAALREEWGGPAVMAEQRRYLAEIGERANVCIRIVPYAARSHIGALVGPFSFLTFPMMPKTRMTQPPVVHIEAYAGDLYLERAEEICHYGSAITELRRIASSEIDSRSMLLRL
ncbi:helix-turn-helix domain-containing protein [Nocardia sp. NPDC004068]|uniref:helix-turn-helix domain-containing protein n=1 Tax=Nocardia sp. NPDC004068 TaxID=3364303 RepID=UPI00368E6E1C